MVAAELLKESRPDGYAHSMGTCYSVGKKKAPNPLSSSSAGSSKAEPCRATTNSMPRASRSSSTGKAQRTQIACLNSSQPAMGRSASTGKGCRTSLASSSAKGPQTPSKKSESSLARGLSSNSDSAHTHPKDSQQARAPSRAEDGRIDASTTENASHTHRMWQSSDGKKQTYHIRSSTDVRDRGSASSGFVAETSKGKQDDGLIPESSPRGSHHLATSRAKQGDGLPVHSRVPEMRAPPMLHKVSSLSLKSGVGPYQVLTPRKSTEGLQGTTPRNSGSKLVKSASFSPSGTKDQGARGVCKNCKTSNLDSVCFIANDGKIAAANTAPATICHFHHCSSPKCAANPNYHPPSPVLCKRVLSKTQPVRSEPARTKPSISVSHTKDDSIVCAQVGDNERELLKCTEVCREDGHIDAETLVPTNQGGKESSNEHSLANMQGIDAQKIFQKNGHSGLISVAQGSDDANEAVKQRDLIEHKDLQRIASKALPYHGDNDSCCSDDGIDTRTYPKRSTRDGALDDLLNMELQQSSTEKAFQPRKSNMERMRQKYLDILKEQEAETIRLKKQEMQVRKQAGEWMLDCAMGEILHKLAPDGEAGVKVLVEAFETIMQHNDGEAYHDEHVAQECIGSEDASKPLHP